jgi:peptidyl-Lys metalloendopeptidase
MYLLLVLLGVSLCCSRELTATIKLVEQATISVEITNSAEYSLAVLRWNLPLDQRFQSDSFRVLLKGTPVTYIGSIVNYAGPFSYDYVFFEPNETKSFLVPLENSYDLSQPGEYDVVMVTDVLDYQTTDVLLPRTRETFSPFSGLISNSLQITTIQGLAQKILRAPYPCSSSENTQLNTAGTASKAMIGRADTRILEGQTATYSEWFGAYTNARWTHVRDVIGRILRNNVVVYRCDSEQGVYAYVYPTDTAHNIYCCGAFWSAPVSGGYDTRAGTLIHELSHFNNIGSTQDYAYGTGAARQLASTNPDRARANADNYEYFSESV